MESQTAAPILEQLRLNRGRRGRGFATTTKFMLTLDIRHAERLASIAMEKGISLQELLRAIVIPFYLETLGTEPKVRILRP